FRATSSVTAARAGWLSAPGPSPRRASKGGPAGAGAGPRSDASDRSTGYGFLHAPAQHSPFEWRGHWQRNRGKPVRMTGQAAPADAGPPPAGASPGPRIELR